MVAAAAIPLAGKLLPFLLKAGSAAKLPAVLRTAGAVGGGLPSLMRGDLGGALLGGGLGALGTAGLGSAATNLGTKAGMKAAQLAGGEGLKATAAGILGRAAVPVAGGLVAGGLTAGVGQRPARNIAGGAAGLAGYGSIGNEGMGGVPLPPGMGPYGNIGPSGYPLDVLSPLGLDAGRRLRTQKDAESLRDATNIVLPTIRKFSEQAKKDDFARSMAARGIAQNIATNAALTQGMAAATRQLGTTAAQQAGTALTTQYNY